MYESVSECVRENRDELLAYANSLLRRTGEYVDAEDYLHEAVCKLLQEDDIGTVTIAALKRNIQECIIDQVRWSKRKKRGGDWCKRSIDTILNTKAAPSATSDVDEEKIGLAMQRMSEQERAVLKKRFWEDKTVQEVADEMKLSKRRVEAIYTGVKAQLLTLVI